jgi:hypothetical protein
MSGERRIPRSWLARPPRCKVTSGRRADPYPRAFEDFASWATATTSGGVPSWVAKMNERTLSMIHGQIGEGAVGEAWEQGRTLTIDEAIALALGA